VTSGHPPTISRREFLTAASAGACVAGLMPECLFAEDIGIVNHIRDEAAKADITVEKLRGNVAVLTGSGGNIAVLPGRDGKLLIDAGITATRRKIRVALAGISNDSVKQLVNTHWHFDHTDGNEWLHSEGATIIAHENTRKHLLTATRVEDWDFTFPAAPGGAVPTILFKDEHVIHVNGTAVALKYYAPAHTDCDISVRLAESDVIHVGDTWWNGYFPFIDYSTGGSIGGMIRATETNLAQVTGKTLIIPGHGPVGDRVQLTEFYDMLVTIHDRVAALKKQGRSQSETVAAKPAAAYSAKWGGFAIDSDFFTRLVYRGV